MKQSDGSNHSGVVIEVEMYHRQQDASMRMREWFNNNTCVVCATIIGSSECVIWKSIVVRGMMHSREQSDCTVFLCWMGRISLNWCYSQRIVIPPLGWAGTSLICVFVVSSCKQGNSIRIVTIATGAWWQCWIFIVWQSTWNIRVRCLIFTPR